MNKKQGKRIDLLDLPVSERKRLCLEIRAALRERASIGKIPLADDVIVADKTMLGSSETKLTKKSQSSDLAQNTLVNALMK